jgi:pimeloyl-ACP methyl ester carboxylesterase
VFGFRIEGRTDLKMLDVLSLAHYVDEAEAAFDELAKRDGCGKIFLLGHSEGSIHASSAAIAKQEDPRFGGLISLSGPSRSILETAIEQIRAIHIKGGSDAAEVDKALADFRSAMLEADEPQFSRLAGHHERALDVVEETNALGVERVGTRSIPARQQREPRQAERKRKPIVTDPLRRNVIHVGRNTVHRRAVRAYDANQHHGRTPIGRIDFTRQRQVGTLRHDGARCQLEGLDRVDARRRGLRSRQRFLRPCGLRLVKGEISLRDISRRAVAFHPTVL